MQQQIISFGILNNGHVVLNTRVSATFLGDYGTIKANGKSFNVPVYWEFTFNDSGKIIAASELGNHHAINEQLMAHVFEAPFETTEKEALRRLRE